MFSQYSVNIGCNQNRNSGENILNVLEEGLALLLLGMRKTIIGRSCAAWATLLKSNIPIYRNHSGKS